MTAERRYSWLWRVVAALAPVALLALASGGYFGWNLPLPHTASGAASAGTGAAGSGAAGSGAAGAAPAVASASATLPLADLVGEPRGRLAQAAGPTGESKVLGVSVAQAAPSRTPFLPAANTSTPSPTPTATATPTPTATATPLPSPTQPPRPPESAAVSGITGYAQSLPLSCESRSAVDWARFFGVEIGELEFQYALPLSDNPNTGFVGNVRGPGGLTPPNGYGAHAPPVARLLRAYGLNAYERSGMPLEDLYFEIADGQPVIVWVIGSVSPGYGFSYTASDGETMTVAPNEHTVIVTGYGQGTVSILDGAMRYTVSTERFLQSWSVLGYQAVVLE